MTKPYILHFVTPNKNASPFDINMAYDAGFHAVANYSQVQEDEIKGLVQDAIFSRGPNGVKHTALLIGGRNIQLAMRMLNAARSAMVPPFEISVMADPSGAFTTAAAMVALVEYQLRQQFSTDLTGKTVSILGATGPVAGCAAVIAAKHGAQVCLVAHRSPDEIEMIAQGYSKTYEVSISMVDGSSAELKSQAIAQADIVLCCAAAGVRVVAATQLAAARNLKIVADVNAVPPTGAEGVEVTANGTRILDTLTVGLGALAIGNVKYRVQQNLLKAMILTEEPLYLDFLMAFEWARNSLK